MAIPIQSVVTAMVSNTLLLQQPETKASQILEHKDIASLAKGKAK